MSAPAIQPGIQPVIQVEIWSDVVCPWCYIGKRRFERAVAELDGEIELDVVVPARTSSTRRRRRARRARCSTPTPRSSAGREQAQMLIDRVTQTAADEGLEFRMDRALRANTLLAHRLLWWAEQPGSPVDQHDLKERLLQAYFHRRARHRAPRDARRLRRRARRRPRGGTRLAGNRRRARRGRRRTSNRPPTAASPPFRPSSSTASGRSLARRTPRRSSTCCAASPRRSSLEAIETEPAVNTADACEDDACDL